MHDTMMRETRDVWKKFDEQLKHFEAKTPEPISEDVQAPGWFFPKRLMRLPSIFNDEATKDMFKDDQQIQTKSDEKGFEVSLDTSLYRPDEIKVNVDKNNVLTVEANHEDKAEDGNKHVSRHFMRKYTLPEGCKAEAVNSNLSSDGVLLITAPKLVLEAPSVKNVPIMQN
jgi:HSP20 family molecular chaperone IbpA